MTSTPKTEKERKENPADSPRETLRSRIRTLSRSCGFKWKKIATDNHDPQRENLRNDRDLFILSSDLLPMSAIGQIEKNERAREIPSPKLQFRIKGENE